MFQATEIFGFGLAPRVKYISPGNHASLRIMYLLTVHLLPQINFTLVAGNMEDVFKIKTVNHTYGEVYVNAPLDRESVDRYLLKVSNSLPP